MQLKKTFFYSLLTLLALLSCDHRGQEPRQTAVIDYVNPFVGTGGHGHTFPGATRPNAMVQFSPDTHLLGWEASSGYHDSDSLVYGFSLTHLSGTGIGDLGDIALLPFSNEEEFDLRATRDLPTHFDKKQEQASVGYYKTLLDKQNIQVELTTTERAGLMRCVYGDSLNRKLVLNLGHILQENWGHKVVKNEFSFPNDSTVMGTYYTKGWAEHHQISYCLQTSLPTDSTIFYTNKGKDRWYLSKLDSTVYTTDEYGLVDNTKIVFHMPKGQDTLYFKVGLSAVSPEQARKNLEAELPHWDFDKVHQQSRDIWQKQLSSIKIKTEDEDVLTNFYTALYHSFIAPFDYQDIDGSYRGMDKQVHQGKPQQGAYTVLSIWDTYRALHPLLTIIAPDKAKAYGQSLVRDYKEGTILPRWPLAANYTGCMPAYHSVSILADLVAKGLAEGEDLKQWTEAAVQSSIYRGDLAEKFAGTRELDLITRHPYYKESLGFVPADSIAESVSWAVEMAYDDWCIARIAEAAGEKATAKAYDKRGLYYKRYWDNEYKLMRPVMADGSFRSPFNPRYSAHMKSDYTEGNAYQWSFYAPHDMAGFIELMGGKATLEANLDTLFTTSSRIDGAEQSADITGLIGQYAHGNEPSHHIAYLYNWTDRPHKGQAILDSIMYNFYAPTPEGIIGNEDCGQMSAWYVMSALGFYQVCPGKDGYSIGRPLVDEATISVKGGEFRILVHQNSKANKYVQSATINGRDISQSLMFSHKDIKAGGVLELTMGTTPPTK